MSQPATFREAVDYFADADVATEFVASLRWPDGFVCPHCTGREYSYVSTRRLWKCKTCKKQSSVKVGTILEDSALGLDKWLPAIWLAANSENEISSHELARALGTTQKSAWFMLHRIRDAEATETASPVEVGPPADDAPADPPGHRPQELVLVAVAFFALGAILGWLAGRRRRIS